MLRFEVLQMYSVPSSSRSDCSSRSFVSPPTKTLLSPSFRAGSIIMREEVANQLSIVDPQFLQTSADNMWIDASLTLQSIESTPTEQFSEMSSTSLTSMAPKCADEENGHVATGHLISFAVTLSPRPTVVPSPVTTIEDALCTLHLDMTHEDRVFFSNFEQLKKALSETGCRVEFATSNNKVSIVGLVPSVHKICAMLVAGSTQSFQIEYRVLHENYIAIMKFLGLFQQLFIGTYYVAFSFEPIQNKPNALVFKFSTNRNNGLNLVLAIQKLMCELDRFRVGRFESPLTCSITIPANRRDLTGRANMHIQQIQKETQTKIEVCRSEDLAFEKVKITGNTFYAVIGARLMLISRFNFELKFQVYIEETRPLVECISKLSLSLKAIFISIEPSQIGSNVKTISISGHQESVSQLFSLREQILDEMKKCNGNRSSVQDLLLT